MTHRVALSLVWLCASAAVSAARVELRPAASDDILFNPGMGVYHQYPPKDLSPEHWSNQVCGVAYCRYDWSTLNPEPGVYCFDEVLGAFHDAWYVKRGVPIAFRVMSQNMHSRNEYVTPKWVFDLGVPSAEFVALGGHQQHDPVFWDERYLEQQEIFLQALGKWLEGRPGIEFMDIGAIGEWGEMHLARWTPEQLAATGYSHYKYVMAYRRIIDAHYRYMPRGTRIFLNVGGQDNHVINDYAFLRGMHFRQDGLKHNGASYRCGEWLYKPYAEKGVLCNYEFHAGYSGMVKRNWSLPQSMDVVLSEPISYLNSNLGIYGDNVHPEVKSELQRVARKIGYRLRPTAVSYLDQVTTGNAKRFPVSITWTNDGLAAPSMSFVTAIGLWRAGEEQPVVATRQFPATPTTAWKPGAEIAQSAFLDLPADVPLGDYELRVGLILPETEQVIKLACANRDATGSCVVGAVKVIAATKAYPALLYEENFDDPARKTAWGATCEGFQTEIVAGQGVDGSRCLRFYGDKVKNAWNYVGAGRLAQTVPWGSYRLSMKMKVLAYPDDVHGRPHPKLAIHNLEDKWVANQNGTHYDMRRKGEWQELSVVLHLEDDERILGSAIETGAYATDIMGVDILLDDIRLELISEP
ncbi:MAG: DUF4832 domain-containing protein [Lentisphaeria bacterium]|jgi:hypothetical protein